MASNQAPDVGVVVVMVPFVAHGHLNQLFRLSRIFSTYNIPVHFINTSTLVGRLRSRFPESNDLIRFHEIPTPSEVQHADGSELAQHLRTPVFELMLSLSTTTQRVVVVHDILMHYVIQDVKMIPNAETYLFIPCSAFNLFWLKWEVMGSSSFPTDMPFNLQEIKNRLPDNLSPEVKDSLKLNFRLMNYHVGTIIDSSRVIEAGYIDYLEGEENNESKKIWAIGPFSHVDKSFMPVLENRHECLQWLDSQPPNSVVYVSFGTAWTFSDEQYKELAMGLERSHQKFIWVLRAADKKTVFSDEVEMIVLPDGFEERVKGRGLVLRGWAPQMEILEHFATGGFMTHCGWNSIVESISIGVPLAVWPLEADQPLNSLFLTNLLKIGLVVKEWEHRKELVSSVVVEDVIKRLMDSREADEIRKNAAELGVRVRKSVAKGGISLKITDSLISYIRRPV